MFLNKQSCSVKMAALVLCTIQVFQMQQVDAFAPALTSAIGSGNRIQSRAPTDLSIGFGTIEMANLLYDDTSTAFDAWEWTANLGAPAALVAGAVLVTLSETRQDMAPKRTDKPWIRVIKQLCRFLLLSSFAMQVVSIFVSTMTGTVLLSHGPQLAAAKQVGYSCPLGLLFHHHEFEYLAIQINFLQGLFHWLAAVALELFVPKPQEGTSSKKMNVFMASCLGSLCLWILSFYNHHIPFYSDYGSMLLRYFQLGRRRFFGSTFRPMSLLYGPSLIYSAVLGYRAFNSRPELDTD